ncbi:Inner membrane magnesium transporter MRS2 [Malassezia obtusa]|uniref:Magnesium transporter n=1 Tax=Malassezia obtusa TaxID=76774 RepID=A0AAF0E0Q3_9BASI|nr:Inner membrane magnesium transporter MRS2 [Malassezia obtusa]
MAHFGSERVPWAVSRALHATARRAFATAPSTEPPTESNTEPSPKLESVRGQRAMYDHPFSSWGSSQLSPHILLRCTILDSKGQVKSISGLFRKSDLCAHHGLEPRDLRKIDSRVPNLVPTILARRSGILINILHIRAMVKSDAVLLFDSYGNNDSRLNSAFVYHLEYNLRLSSSKLPYEFRALESIFASVLDALRSELSWLRLVVEDVLETLEDDIDREKLRMLLQISRKLHGFLSRSRGIKTAATEVLDNDEDMALMYLTAAKEGHPRNAKSSMEELELLLESFEKQVEEVVAEIESMYANVNNTQEIAELMLDSNRNRILSMELRIGIVTLGFTMATFVAGLFGMNLVSGLEEHPYAFYVTTAATCILAMIVSINGVHQLAKMRRVGLSVNNLPSANLDNIGKPEAHDLTHARAWWWREKQFRSQRRAQASRVPQDGYTAAQLAQEQALAESSTEHPLDPSELSTNPSPHGEPLPAATMERPGEADEPPPHKSV